MQTQTPETPARAHARPEPRRPEPRVRTAAPAVDIFEDGDRLCLLVDLPGVATDGVRLGVEKDVLTIEARSAADFPGDATYSEFGPVAYYRAFALGDDLDTARISAAMKNGVLELVLPKAERAKTKKIQVNVG